CWSGSRASWTRSPADLPSLRPTSSGGCRKAAAADGIVGYGQAVNDEQPVADRAPATPRWRRVARSLVIVSTIVVVLAVAARLGPSLCLEHGFAGQVEPLTAALPPEGGRPAADESGVMNILLLGSDKRVDGSVVGQGSDVMMLIHVA